MNAILGFAQVLESETLTVAQHDAVQEIQRAGDHLIELISDLLDLSRVESGNLAISMLPIQLRSVIADSLQIVQPALRRNRIRLINEGLDAPVVLADKTRLRQILVNLLSNAAKYNAVGGTVTIRSRVTADDWVRVEVSDTGAGIPAERMSALFKPFERLGAQMEGIEGTGIGLALTKQLIELMGARIGVDSTPGHGSTFWVELRTAVEPT
jgi:signal transduction histidine kinase